MTGPGTITISVDGRPLVVPVGHTVAAALLAAGQRTWRDTRSGAPRGLFCGIGVCFDCLVVVNGLPDVRACQRVAAAGDDVRTQRGPCLPHDAQPLAPVDDPASAPAPVDMARPDGPPPDAEPA